MFKKYIHALVFFMNIAGVTFSFNPIRRQVPGHQIVVVKGSFLKSLGYMFLLLVFWMLLVAGLFVAKANITQNASFVDVIIIFGWSLLLAPVIAVLIMKVLFWRFTDLLRAQIRNNHDALERAQK
jgi:hypothetical protein